MTIQEFKQKLLDGSIGGIMYDASEGSELVQLVLDNQAVANATVHEISNNASADGIEKGLMNFICESLAKVGA